MNKEEILEGNKLIAEFMGWYCVGYCMAYNHNECDKVYIIEDFKYNSSWDWLMPVVIKMASTNEYASEYDSFYIEGNPLACFSTSETYDVNLDLQILWNEVVGFIKWYNQNKLNETN